MLLVSHCCEVIYASENNNELSYVVERTNNFLAKTGYIKIDSIMLSNPITITSSESEILQNVYYVFDGDTIVGQILVSEIYGEFLLFHILHMMKYNERMNKKISCITWS